MIDENGYFSKCRKLGEAFEAGEAHIYETEYLEALELVGEAFEMLCSTTVQVQLFYLVLYTI